MTHSPSFPLRRRARRAASRPPVAALALALAWWVWVGCSGPLSSARSAYEQGRYAQAAAALCEAQAAGGDDPSLQLYLGLNFLALGDVMEASPHLEAARRYWLTQPQAFSRPERAALRAALSRAGAPIGLAASPTVRPRAACIEQSPRPGLLPYRLRAH